MHQVIGRGVPTVCDGTDRTGDDVQLPDVDRLIREPGGLALVCCLKTMLATSARGNTVRSPFGPSMKSAGAGFSDLMSSRILSMTDVMVCVVNTLATTTWPGGRRPSGRRQVPRRATPHTIGEPCVYSAGTRPPL